MKVNKEQLDRTFLDEQEQELAFKLLAAYGQTIFEYFMNKGANAAIQLAIGAALRMVKYNLEGSLAVVHTDLSQLTLPGLEDGKG